MNEDGFCKHVCHSSGEFCTVFAKKERKLGAVVAFFGLMTSLQRNFRFTLSFIEVKVNVLSKLVQLSMHIGPNRVPFPQQQRSLVTVALAVEQSTALYKCIELQGRQHFDFNPCKPSIFFSKKRTPFFTTAAKQIKPFFAKIDTI